MSEEEKQATTEPKMDWESQALTPIQHLARDLGLDPESVGPLNLADILKLGPDSTLFIARVSQVYYETSHLQHELGSLREQLAAEKKKRKQAEARAYELERSKILLEKEAEYYSTRGQNSVFSTILFGLGSVAIGIAGSYFAREQYEPSILAAVIGLALSVFAAVLLLRKKKT